MQKNENFVQPTLFRKRNNQCSISNIIEKAFSSQPYSTQDF